MVRKIVRKKTIGSSFISVILLVLMLGISGCMGSSMNKALHLHQKKQEKQALEVAISILKSDEEESVRVDAVGLIGRIGRENPTKFRKKSGESLIPYLNDPSPFVTSAVIKNLGLIAYPNATNALINLSLDANEDRFEEITIAIRHIGQPAFKLLNERYQQESQDQFRSVYKALLTKTQGATK